jgi:hypothetical protein
MGGLRHKLNSIREKIFLSLLIAKFIVEAPIMINRLINKRRTYIYLILVLCNEGSSEIDSKKQVNLYIFMLRLDEE